MKVAVIDVGSNTARLLVASVRGTSVTTLREERAYLALGEEVLRSGRISRRKLAETSKVVRAYAALADKLSVDLVEVIVTAPGRQSANGDVLVKALERAARAPVRVLTPEQEGQLAYVGAVSCGGSMAAPIAVCDVGGGSTELVLGDPSGLPTWWRSVETGSLRLTSGFLRSDPPTRSDLLGARAAVEQLFCSISPPRPQAALATGGSARALAKLVGKTLGEEELSAALVVVTKWPKAKLAKRFGIDPPRARTLAAGALILTEVVGRLGVPLELARGGLREGAAFALSAERVAA